MLSGFVLIGIAAAIAIAARAAFTIVSARSAVDHYYWMLAARAYRQSGGLPVRIRSKYLLEDERQAYPPLFGWVLGKLPEHWLRGAAVNWLAQVPDILVLVMLAAFAFSAGAPLQEIAVLVLVFGTAPVLAAYNAQIASRGLGNLFLVTMLLAAALGTAHPGIGGDIFYVVAIAAAAGVVLTHKMTVQLLLALWLPWAWVLGDWRVLLIPPLAIAAAALITGFRFAGLQWRAHADIVSFWHRHRDELGANLVRHSPLYGDYARRHETTFHRPGPRGWLAHAMLAFSYVPLLWFALLTLLWTAAPSGWIVLWSAGTSAVALLTLYVPWLRCIGGGHLYLYNAVAPTALWWGFVLREPNAATLALFAIGCVATLASLALGLRRRAALVFKRDEGFQAAVANVAALPPGRIAVFPMTASDEVAFRTPHAVLWGGHGLGFRLLEPVFPVMRERLAKVMQDNGCNLLLIDLRYWPDGERVARAELAGVALMRFGEWLLAMLPAASSTGADVGVPVLTGGTL
jgi:hypothetical protein